MTHICIARSQWFNFNIGKLISFLGIQHRNVKKPKKTKNKTWECQQYNYETAYEFIRSTIPSVILDRFIVVQSWHQAMVRHKWPAKISLFQQVFLCKSCLKPFKTELGLASFKTFMWRLAVHRLNEGHITPQAFSKAIHFCNAAFICHNTLKKHYRKSW